MRFPTLAAVYLLLTTSAVGQDLQFVRVADDGRSFVLPASGKPYVPWGFNYDHDRDGRLIEDYWYDEWATVWEDFHEMKALGTNVVRIHLQFGKFMDAADQPNEQALAQLARLVRRPEIARQWIEKLVAAIRKQPISAIAPICPIWPSTCSTSGRVSVAS